jgi:uncharacterized protein YdeI (YjbR/CyaY-like superfamily)
MKTTPDKKIPGQLLSFTSRESWRAWLEEHHATSQQAWLLIGRKGGSSSALRLNDAVDEALCFGWIDSTLQPVDKDTYALRFSPRQSASIWSVHNQARHERLIQEGRMTSTGLEKISQAKRSGEWQANVLREDVTSVPDDLAQALEENDARIAFENWPASQKKMYLYWLERTKKPATRQKRIQAILEKANKPPYLKW